MAETGGTARDEVISALADVIVSLRRCHPTRVAIDGNSCSGKTALADEVAAAVQVRGRQVLRASFDDFHALGTKYRSMRGEWTPQLYYDEGYDYARFLEFMLDPLTPGGSWRCRTKYLDSFQDVVLPEEWQEVADDAVVIVDGIFLLRADLANHWDFVICLDVDVETMIARAYERDGAWYGSMEAVERRYRQHRLPVYQHYQRLTNARARAHCILDNEDIARPRLVRLTQA